MKLNKLKNLSEYEIGEKFNRYAVKIKEGIHLLQYYIAYGEIVNI
jgi:hypothetical protein